jgi:hypothetical protein
VPKQDRIHNPHYYEWLRTNSNGGEIRREPGDGDGVCNGEGHLIGISQMNAKIKRLIQCYDMNKDIIDNLWNIYRFVNHIRAVELIHTYPFTQLVDVQNNMELRKQFMRGTISKEKYQIELQKRDKKRRKNNEFHQVLLTFTEVATENINKFCNEHDQKITLDTVLDLFATIHELKDYINQSCAVIGSRYNNVYPWINVCGKSGNWSLIKQK